MENPLQNTADELFATALEGSGGRDPRQFYRDRLGELKAANPGGYDKAVTYYRDELIPSIADQGRDPVEAWQEYGARLAAWTNPGHPVEIDESGRAHPHEPPAANGRLVLHLPDGKGRALVVDLPSELTEAQRATYDLLVAGKQKLRREAPQ
jgi:hypothetical protein